MICYLISSELTTCTLRLIVHSICCTLASGFIFIFLNASDPFLSLFPLILLVFASRLEFLIAKRPYILLEYCIITSIYTFETLFGVVEVATILPFHLGFKSVVLIFGGGIKEFSSFLSSVFAAFLLLTIILLLI